MFGGFQAFSHIIFSGRVSGLSDPIFGRIPDIKKAGLSGRIYGAPPKFEIYFLGHGTVLDQRVELSLPWAAKEHVSRVRFFLSVR